jgi:predicted ATP-dependent endonuclease of OLD family
MLLKKVNINKYKSYITPQSFEVENGITRIVGKNESGKTAILEALAKFNYFEDDTDFKYNETLDYPRNELKTYQREGVSATVISCEFQIDDDLLNVIEEDLGNGILPSKCFLKDIKYNGNASITGINTNFSVFKKHIIKVFKPNGDLSTEIEQCSNFESLKAYSSQHPEELKTLNDKLAKISSVIENYSWSNKLDCYVYFNYLRRNIPKFWYFDEYYSMPSRININSIIGKNANQTLSKEEYSTVTALLDLANLNINELSTESNFESFKAELEATSNGITDEMFEYWSTNDNLEIRFEVEHEPSGQKYLNIRIYNKKHRVSLPLKNRSKGFIWFFSFLVWFSRIQGKKNCRYILLLDEPGLSLHAAAQADLLRFIEEKLAPDYQVIYTTHSPFMIDSKKLNEIRTVFDSQNVKIGSAISNAIQEKDPATIFPLQAALGYDIAQNLFISPKNLIVEGVSDLMYLTAISEELKLQGKTGLSEDITIVPVGGMDKVATFISLLRGQKLHIACLLDNFTDAKGKQKIDDLIREKIIKEKNIRYFGEFANLSSNYADLEDMFLKTEYIDLFNKAFAKTYPTIENSNIVLQDKPILMQINKIINKDRFNHYLPANEFLKIVDKRNCLSEDTFDKFSLMFNEINKLF